MHRGGNCVDSDADWRGADWIFGGGVIACAHGPAPKTVLAVAGFPPSIGALHQPTPTAPRKPEAVRHFENRKAAVSMRADYSKQGADRIDVPGSIDFGPVIVMPQRPSVSVSTALLATIAIAASSFPALAEIVSRERDIIGLRLGQRIQVDDGSCPTGQIKEVTGTTLTENGVARTIQCVPRVVRK
jgi:hypothetical protein